MSIFAVLKAEEIAEDLLLEADEHTTDDLLVLDGDWLELVWHHVVDILHEDDICLKLVEILDECAMTAWTEHKASVFIAERSIIHRSSNSVGR